MIKKELLFSVTKNDFSIERTKGSGKGGQNRNKRETAIRLTHKATGIQSYCADERNQHQNLIRAFKNLISKTEFKAWLRIETGRRMQNKAETEKKIQEWITDQMQDKNLKIEYF